MKPILKPLLFLVLLSIFDLLLRKGIVPIPIPLPSRFPALLFFSIFAIVSWVLTKKFAQNDQMTLSDLGISFDSKNRKDFFYGFLVGFVLWAFVSLTQTVSAGFSWEFRPNLSLFSIIHGLIFIFIADLGTELFTRGYPLTKLKNGFGAHAAIIIMTLFVALKSFSFQAGGSLLFYSILIPCLHTIFFSIIYFKTKRLGASLGMHTGANFVTLSIFDLREANPNQAIPSGIFQSNVDIETLSLTALQLPWVLMAFALCIACYIWWKKY